MLGSILQADLDSLADGDILHAGGKDRRRHRVGRQAGKHAYKMGSFGGGEVIEFVGIGVKNGFVWRLLIWLRLCNCSRDLSHSGFTMMQGCAPGTDATRA
jgi:hypothetical protein